MSLSNVESVETEDQQVNQSNGDWWKQSINRHHDYLVDRMLPDFGLVDKLYSGHVLTNEEKNRIKAESIIQQRNRLILEFIDQKNAHEKLIEVLGLSNQMHLIRYLRHDGHYMAGYGGEWPLTEKEIAILDSNFEVLVDLLAPTELLGHLLSSKVINSRQLEFISSKPTSYEKNEALLEFLRRSSLSCYWLTVSCLHATNQQHIAEILERGGVVVRIRSEIEGVDDQTEQEIITSFANVLRNRPLDESRRILEGTLNVIALKEGQSIIIYVYCRTLKDLMELEEMQLSGELSQTVKSFFTQIVCSAVEAEVTADNMKSLVESIFTRILHQSQINEVSVTLSDKEFEKYIPYFLRTENVSISDTPFSDLPLEILNIILSKAYLSSIQRKDKSRDREDDVIMRMASVDNCWFKGTTNARFKKVVWHQIRRFYKSRRSSWLTYKYNKQFIQETSRFLKEIKTLKRSDCLSDIESAVISRQKSSTTTTATTKQEHFRKQELVKFSDDIKLDDFIRCLCQKGKKLTARIISNREAVVRIEFRKPPSSAETASFLQYVKRLRETKDKPSFASETENITSQLKAEGLEILHSMQDRDTVVWIWCHSPEALENLKQRIDSRSFAKHFSQMTKEKFKIQRLRSVDMDSDQLKKEFDIFSSMIGDIRVELDFREVISRAGSLVGVTKLGNKIHVLFFGDYYPTLRTFEDRFPFCLQKESELKNMKVPTDIGSSERDRCLYALDYGTGVDNSYIWTIKEDNAGEEMSYKVSKWLTLEIDFSPQTLSVSSKGQLLMVSNNGHLVNLRIYGSKTELLLSIRLNEDIKVVRHAVQTSTGHFIVFHQMKKDKVDSDAKTKKYEEEEEKKTKDDQEKEQRDDETNVVMSKLSRDGKTVICRFSFQSSIPKTSAPGLNLYPAMLNAYFCIDSSDRVFLADADNDRVILLDSNLHLMQILIPANENVTEPHRLFYDEGNKQLIVGRFDEINVYTLNL